MLMFVGFYPPINERERLGVKEKLSNFYTVRL